MSDQIDVSSLTFEVTERIRKKLAKMKEMGGSDLHIKANSKVYVRVNGEITPVSEKILTKEDALTFAKELLRGRFPKLVEQKELDLIYIYDEHTRYRVNVFFQIDGVSAVFRAISDTKYTIDELQLPQALKEVTQYDRGLVLVTGITGSGKSTTLASLIHEINRTQNKHIITIEDPIEFTHNDEQSIINQRSVGQDTHSFANALKAALREDPDIILVGEMRDVETIEMALHAAETGHLVFSTLHTVDSKETINRIVSTFSPHQQENIRYALSNVLKAIVSQRLARTKEGGRKAAVELMFSSERIRTMIREKRDHEIFQAVSEGRTQGMQTFDQALYDMVTEGIITEEEALYRATSSSDLKLKLDGRKDGSAPLGGIGTIKLKVD